ncbi:6367_t:CDS:1, partial [Entrophospora sp. SA101]
KSSMNVIPLNFEEFEDDSFYCIGGIDTGSHFSISTLSSNDQKKKKR